MKVSRIFASLLFVTAVNFAQAAVVSGSGTNYAYTYGDWYWPTYYSDPSGITRLQFTTPAAETAKYGVQANVDALAGGTSVKIDNNVVYQPNFNFFYEYAGAGLNFRITDKSVGGKVRVKVDYNLFAEGARSAVLLRLTGQGTHLNADKSRIEETPVDIYTVLQSDGPAKTLTGSLTSDWIPFSSVDDLWMRGKIVDTPIYWGAWVTTYNDSYDLTPGTGGILKTHADFNVTYEIMAVPEPETYATLFAGLLMTGAALRRKARKARSQV